MTAEQFKKSEGLHISTSLFNQCCTCAHHIVCPPKVESEIKWINLFNRRCKCMANNGKPFLVASNAICRKYTRDNANYYYGFP